MSALYDISPLFGLPLAKYFLKFRTDTPLSCVHDIAPLIRSRMGFILKGRVCPFFDFEKRTCAGCENASACLYTILFSPVESSLGTAGSCARPVRPFTLCVAGGDDRGSLMRGETASVGLTLFGERAILYRRIMLETIFHAVASIFGSSLKGRGAENNDSEHPLVPISWSEAQPCRVGGRWTVKHKGEEVIGKDETGIALKNWIQAMPPGSVQKQGRGNTSIEIRLVTPLQSGRLNHIVFLDFIKAITGRIRDLKRVYHMDNDMGFFSPGFYKAAGSIKVVADIKKQRNAWYSRRQKRDVFLDGVTGRILFQGNIAPFVPILKAGALTGVGKKLTYGLGQIEIGG